MSNYDWNDVEYFVSEARGIAFDTCHKIYILMDDQQVEKMREYGYEVLFTADEQTPTEMYRTVEEWYEDSCMLRFVSAVRTVFGDPNDGFTDLIPQGWGEEEEY
jgi:hypothetical protein